VSGKNVQENILAKGKRCEYFRILCMGKLCYLYKTSIIVLAVKSGTLFL